AGSFTGDTGPEQGRTAPWARDGGGRRPAAVGGTASTRFRRISLESRGTASMESQGPKESSDRRHPSDGVPRDPRAPERRSPPRGTTMGVQKPNPAVRLPAAGL